VTKVKATDIGEQSLVSNETRDRLRGVARPLALAFGRIGLTPNALTVIGFLGTCVAGVAAASQLWLAAGILVIVFGIFDMFDGALARATGRASRFGAFLDSTLDRTGESLVLAGIAYGAADAGHPVLAGLAATAIAFASVVTYARAKAEVLGLKGDVGVAPRPERLVILAIGLALAAQPWSRDAIVGALGNGNTWLTIALALITILSAITVVQRIVVVRRQLNESGPK
jgi:CDP-diacylglycerol--glycerol-3-phosphate 3-phosphatidyltransferase